MFRESFAKVSGSKSFGKVVPVSRQADSDARDLHVGVQFNSADNFLYTKSWSFQSMCLEILIEVNWKFYDCNAGAKMNNEKKKKKKIEG